MKSVAPLPVKELCALLGVEAPASLDGVAITGVATLEKAKAGDLSFVTKEKFFRQAATSEATVLLVPRDFPADAGGRHIAVDNVMLSLISVLEHVHPAPARTSFQHPTAVVASDANIGEGVCFGPGGVLEEGVTIGAGTRIEANSFVGAGSTIGGDCWLSPSVTILFGTRIGSRVRIHSGSVLGADGFRFEFLAGRLRKIPQVGIVVIEDDVEIGANCTIDRAFLEETRVGARTKMDNNVHIGHNVVVGSDCVLVAQVGIGGSTRIGRGVMIGGGASLKDHITVGDGVRIGGRSAVQGDLAPGAQVIGTPAIDVKAYARFSTFYRNFGETWPKVRQMLADHERNRGDA